MKTHIGLFEGIGGFSVAARWMNWETIAWCEINPFCQTILKYHYPNATTHSDIINTDFTIYRGQCDVLTGGFPCQPYSAAGKRLGKEDERHLWPHMLRAIREIQPRWVVGENVRGLVNWNGGLVFDEVQSDLEDAGYKVLPFLLPACAKNAPHRRERIWFIAYADSRGVKQGQGERGIQPTTARQPEEADTFSQPRKMRSSANSKSDGEHRAPQPQDGSGQGGERWRRDIDNLGEVPGQDGSTDAANPDLPGRQQGNEKVEGGSTEQSHSMGISRDDANPDDQRLDKQPRDAISDQSGQYSGLPFPKCDWSDWPTQPPIRSRDDGFSPELPGITVSRHRVESIKAYGNAVVPPLVYEIFKVIELYDEKEIRDILLPR